LCGIGLQIAKHLLRDYGDRFYVFLGSRTLSKGEAATKEIHDQGLRNCEALHIDVTDDGSIAKAAKTVEDKKGRVDVLHVNAGICPDIEMLKVGESLSKTINVTMATNVAGAAQTAETFLPLLKKAQNPRIVFMSSGLGSVTRYATPSDYNMWPAYASSKAALNMMMLWFWRRFPDMKINSCCPGFRSTYLNHFGTDAPAGSVPGKVEDATANAVRLTLLGKDGESGTFTEWRDGAETWKTVPW